MYQSMRTRDGMARIPSQHQQVLPKPSTACILCTTNNNNTDKDNNKLCMVTKTKRTSKNEYYWSGSTVFPGGLLDPASDGQFVDICLKYYSLWCKKYNFKFDDIMYRLNGLRELFEETGILLSRSKESINSLIENNDIVYPLKASIFDNRKHKLNVTEWRYKIMKDSYQFETLYQSLDLVPDILSLVPWARIQTPWFTGTMGRDAKRWDVKFYLALIDEEDAKIATNGDKDDNGQVVNALGKEIFRIDWVDINEAFGPKKIKKYKSIPFVTSIQLAEFYQIIHIENALYKEWKNAYFNRNIVAIRFKSAVRKPDNNIINLFNGDYLYDQVCGNQDVECDMEKENNPKYLQRIMFNKKTGYKMFKVLNEYKRLYQYSDKQILSKL